MREEAGLGATKRFWSMALLLCLVLLWGFGHRLFATLNPQFVTIFALKGWRGAISQSLYDIGYIFLPLPAMIYARQFGYKAALILSLGCLMVGTFTLYPAAEMHALSYYITAVSFMAVGWVTLENAANPLLIVMGPAKTAVRRLNLAQCLYPIGAIAGITAGHWVQSSQQVFPHAGDSVAIAHPYIVVGAVVLVLAFAFEEIGFPEAASERAASFSGIGDEIASLLSQPLFLFALAAQSCCILAIGVVWTLAGPALDIAFSTAAKSWWQDGFLVCTILFAVGRITSTALLFHIPAEKLLLAQMSLAAAMALLAALTGGETRAVLVLALNLPLAFAWPTIIALALRGRGQELKLAGGMLSIAGAIGGLILELMCAPSTALSPGLMLAAAFAGILVIAGFARAPHNINLKLCETSVVLP